MTYFLLTFLPALARAIMWGILAWLVYYSFVVREAVWVLFLYLVVGWGDVYGPGFKWVGHKAREVWSP